MENFIPNVNDSPYKRIFAIGDVHAAFAYVTSKPIKKNIFDSVVSTSEKNLSQRQKSLGFFCDFVKIFEDKKICHKT